MHANWVATGIFGIVQIGLYSAQSAQQGGEASATVSAEAAIRSLPLDARKRLTLQEAVGSHNYEAAEDILADEAIKNPQSQPLLLVLADVFFLDGKQLECAKVLKKAESLSLLDERARFLLALSYVVVDRKMLAVTEFERLAQSNPSNAVYPYWLSRLAYRNSDLRTATSYAEKAVQINPAFMKAYDQLGLCYTGLNQTDKAVRAFKAAIRLNQEQSMRWSRPAMNLGTLLLQLERLDEAEAQLRDAVRVDPHFPVAHFRLGRVLEKKEREREAIAELEQAVTLDSTYPDPHYALNRIYRKLGDLDSANRELKIFENLRKTDKKKNIMRPG